MAWIESHQELAMHPKTRKLARLLDVPIPQAIGMLHCLWWWALDYAEDGDISRADEEDIAVACMWEGDPDVLLSALRSARFLDDDRHLHDWDDYAGRLLDRREANAERARASRARRRTVRERDADVTGLQNSTVPNQTVPDLPPSVAAPADAAPAPRKRTAKQALVPLSAEERSKLETEFEDIPDVSGVIDLALSHESARKYPANQYGYVRNWLRRDRERQPVRFQPRFGARASPPPVRDEYLELLRKRGMEAGNG